MRMSRMRLGHVRLDIVMAKRLHRSLLNRLIATVSAQR
jgi:hypothetical protein